MPFAQTAVEPAGAPPPDITATVTAPAAPADAPKPNLLYVDSTAVAISAGGQFAGGNSQSYAGTAQECSQRISGRKVMVGVKLWLIPRVKLS